MGFELPEQGSGAQGRVWCVRTGEAPGPRSGLWCEVWVRARSDRSSLWQDSAHGGSVSHPDQLVSQPNIHRHLLCISLTLICGTFILASSNVMQVWQKKEWCQQGFFYYGYSFCTQDADTKTHKGTHSGTRQSHSSCGNTKTQTGACAHTLQHIPRGTLQRCIHVAMASVSGSESCGEWPPF